MVANCQPGVLGRGCLTEAAESVWGKLLRQTQLTISAEGLIFVLTRLYFYSVLLPYETATFQLRSPQKQKIGLHSPDLHKMLIGPKARR